jgi:type I restriction enzyme M protein
MARSKGTGKGRGKKNEQPQTTRQKLSAVIKRVRDKLREDAGLGGDADRLPQLTWMLFLKFLDDHERAQEDAYGDAYAPIIQAPYRWRDWAPAALMQQAKKGDELLDFVNKELFPHLSKRSGSGEHDLRSVVGKIFQGTYNRLRSGYILREVVEKLDEINFNASDDVHLVSHFYETMLREMRDAAGDSGEFYTPRPVIRLIIDRLAPKRGERILDPACGTCGFLVEAHERLKAEARTPALKQQLESNLLGIEKKTMPYLLGIVNLLLHGVEEPAVKERNTLGTPIREIKDEDRVDMIATNPPFGGEEEPGIVNSFPEGLRTKETAVLFVQYVMARLKKPGGRAGIVLPNGFLFGEGIMGHVKKQLLERFNLHTIVRLPQGVFAPYTSITTNLLFFEAGDPEAEGYCTKEVWYYEHPLPEGRKQYTKQKTLEFEEFKTLIEWWDSREENEHAWKFPFLNNLRQLEEKARPHWEAAGEAKREADRLAAQVEELKKQAGADESEIDVLRGQEQSQREIARTEQAKGDALYWSAFNIEIKNPRTSVDLQHRAPEELIESMIANTHRVLEIMEECRTLLNKQEGAEEGTI